MNGHFSQMKVLLIETQTEGKRWIHPSSGAIFERAHLKVVEREGFNGVDHKGAHCEIKNSFIDTLKYILHFGAVCRLADKLVLTKCDTI